MTNLLLRLFVKNDTTSPAGRARVGRLSGVVGILCNIALFAAKLVIGTVSGSVAITADALNNLSDASSAIVTLIGFKLAEKPADDDHPYGHARFEYLSGLAVAAMIIVIGFELAKSSVDKIFHPTPVSFSFPMIAVLLLSIAAKLWMAMFNRKLGKLIHSSALLATASDSRNDVIATAAVLVCAVIGHLTKLQIDGYIGLGVALFILYSGANLAKETISPLLGENASPQLRQLIIDTVKNTPKVLGYHDLMVHDYGPGQRFASMHVEMDRNEDPMECHNIIDDLERECFSRHNVHLIVHYDPIVVGDAALEQMRRHVQETIRTYDPRMSIHDFRMVQGTGHTNLIFDAVLPFDLAGKEKAIKAYLDETLAQTGDTRYYTVITFDYAAYNQE